MIPVNGKKAVELKISLVYTTINTDMTIPDIEQNYCYTKTKTKAQRKGATEGA